MGHCRYSEDPDDNGLNGYNCSIIGEHIEWNDTRDRCRWETGYEDCPYYTGEPILTEEVAADILSSFNDAVRKCQDQLDEMADDIYRIAQNTSMYSISNILYYAARYSMDFPDASGIYDRDLKLRSEAETARQLEADLHESANSINVRTLPECDSSRPVVSGRDFEELSVIASVRCDDAASALRNVRASFSGEGQSKFGEPLEEYGQKCSETIWMLKNYLMGAIKDAESEFVGGLPDDSFSAGSVGSIISDPHIRWEYSDR